MSFHLIFVSPIKHISATTESALASGAVLNVLNMEVLNPSSKAGVMADESGPEPLSPHGTVP